MENITSPLDCQLKVEINLFFWFVANPACFRCFPSRGLWMIIVRGPKRIEASSTFIVCPKEMAKKQSESKLLFALCYHQV